MPGQASALRLVPSEKRCPKCEETKPLGEFYDSKRGKDSWCKACQRQRRVRYTDRRRVEKLGKEIAYARKRRLVKRQRVPDGHKLCGHCEKAKLPSEFHRGNRQGKFGVGSLCKSCTAIKQKEYHSRSPRNRLRASYNTAMDSARRRRFEFSISLDDLEEMWNSQNGCCFYTGIPMSYSGDRLPESVSVDRLDSTRGYALSNIVLCCNYVNLMKNNRPVEEFFRWCELVIKHQKEVCYG